MRKIQCGNRIALGPMLFPFGPKYGMTLVWVFFSHVLVPGKVWHEWLWWQWLLHHSPIHLLACSVEDVTEGQLRMKASSKITGVSHIPDSGSSSVGCFSWPPTCLSLCFSLAPPVCFPSLFHLKQEFSFTGSFFFVSPGHGTGGPAAMAYLPYLS